MMKSLVYRVIKPIVPKFAINLRKRVIHEKNERLRLAKELRDWEENGRPAPPPHAIKQRAIQEYQNKYGCKILIETGTYIGTMVEAQKKIFGKVISIELGMDLYMNAKKRFEKDRNVTIVQGDSGKVLPGILMNINEPVIFWLDGHYSSGVTALGDKECPIYEELDAIFANPKLQHVILIDDARCFNGTGDYPTTEKLTDYVLKRNEKYKVEIKDDIIRYAI